MKTGKPGRVSRLHPQSLRGQPHPLSEDVRALLSAVSARPRRARSPPDPQGQTLPDPFEGLVTQQQAADLYGVTKRTIRNWQRDGIIEAVKGPKGRVFYRLDDLLRLIGAG
nr:helix-turn-helix domain-containing protein [uncultured Rhodopila sp.]